MLIIFIKPLHSLDRKWGHLCHIDKKGRVIPSPFASNHVSITKKKKRKQVGIPWCLLPVLCWKKGGKVIPSPCHIEKKEGRVPFFKSHKHLPKTKREKTGTPWCPLSMSLHHIALKRKGGRLQPPLFGSENGWGGYIPSPFSANSISIHKKKEDVGTSLCPHLCVSIVCHVPVSNSGCVEWEVVWGSGGVGGKNT